MSKDQLSNALNNKRKKFEISCVTMSQLANAVTSRLEVAAAHTAPPPWELPGYMLGTSLILLKTLYEGGKRRLAAVY